MLEIKTTEADTSAKIIVIGVGGVDDVILHPIENVLPEALAAPLLGLVQAGGIPLQVHVDQPVPLLPENLDSLQPQRIVAGISAIILLLLGDQLLPNPILQSFVYLTLIVGLKFHDFFRGMPV